MYNRNMHYEMENTMSTDNLGQNTLISIVVYIEVSSFGKRGAARDGAGRRGAVTSVFQTNVDCRDGSLVRIKAQLCNESI